MSDRLIMENQLSFTNLMYAANDTPKQQESYVNHSAFNHKDLNQPESYMDPSVLRSNEGCIEEENYEDLRDILPQTTDNIYETLPTANGKEQQSQYQLLEQTIVPKVQIDRTEIDKIKQDLRKTKMCVMILGLLVVVLLLVSITAFVLAVTLSTKATTAAPSAAIGPQAQVAQGNVPDQLTNNSEWINKLSSEIKWLYVEVNTSTRELNDKISDSSIQIWENLTDIHLVLNTVNVHLNMTKSDVQQTTSEVASLQNQVCNAQDDIISIIGTVRDLQSQLNITQTNLNTVNQQLADVRNQLTTANLLLASTSSQVTSLQTSITNRLSSPVNLYRNCHRNTSTCTISRLINDNRRSYCNTPTRNANITVSQSIHVHTA